MHSTLLWGFTSTTLAIAASTVSTAGGAVVDVEAVHEGGEFCSRSRSDVMIGIKLLCVVGREWVATFAVVKSRSPEPFEFRLKHPPWSLRRLSQIGIDACSLVDCYWQCRWNILHLNIRHLRCGIIRIVLHRKRV
jgi:hypothetical protein